MEQHKSNQRKQHKGNQRRNAMVRGLVRIGEEAAANFRAWHERNFINPRAGRIGCTSYLRAGSFDDHPGDGLWYGNAYERGIIDYHKPLGAEELSYIVSHPLIALQLAAGITDLRGLRCMRRGLTLRVNQLQRRAYRSRYYAQENARRRQLAAERRKIRERATTNPCPTPDEFRAAFSRVGESVEAKLLFGGMVHDLACYVDSCLRYDANGNIVGRNGGIKEWLADNVPELFPRYKTIMRYKALAVRLRQAVGIKDPTPTSALFGEEAPNAEEMEPIEGAPGGEDGTIDEKTEQNSAARHENYFAYNSHYLHEETRRERLLMRQIVHDCGNTFRDIFDKVDSMLGRAGPM